MAFFLERCMKINTAPKPVFTHEGAKASAVSPKEELARTVMACMLWESGFYESGEAMADRIKRLVPLCAPHDVAAMAVEAREKQRLRHVPLLLVRELARDARRCEEGLIAKTLCRIIQRADELAEFLALYWADGRQPLSKQIKKGLASAFAKFDEYALAKYNRASTVKLRDVLFMVHAKPANEEQAALWKRLVDGQLTEPDTWEVSLSKGADKRETFERLLREGKLGYLALLRNLRNMEQSEVDTKLVRGALIARKGADNVLPFRFLAAAKAAPRYEPELDAAMLAALASTPKLEGKTIAVIDVSGSMYGTKLSRKSDMSRAHAACALAAVLREVCENPVIYATAGSDALRVHKTELVPARRGMALADATYAMCEPLGGGGIFLKQVIDFICTKDASAERVIVITDEQDCGTAHGDSPGDARTIGRHNYIINVATNKNGIAYEKWTHINGFSEAVVQYISKCEQASTA